MPPEPPFPFKDHFSAHAADYSKYRPTYPPQLFSFLAAHCWEYQRTWDCATGNGQAARGLAAHFEEVVATDASTSQIQHAITCPKVRYLAAPAERPPFEDASLDLITVAQALHWFNLEAFYAETRRVLKPRGLIAAWCYGCMSVSPPIDQILQHFYHETVGPYWPPERALVDAAYRSISFPFSKILQIMPCFHMEASWTLPQLLAYIGTWSAVKNLIKARQSDPIPLLAEKLSPLWGNPASTQTTLWPLHLRIGYVPT